MGRPVRASDDEAEFRQDRLVLGQVIGLDDHLEGVLVVPVE
ncbi:MAG TPA: hypothetical protein VGK54_03030 [Chloroflexota bacterium]